MHTYAEDTTGAAPNNIRVTITDNEGSRIIRTNTATVLDAPLESVGAPSIPGVMGILLSVSNPFVPDIATFTDANPNPPIADFTALVDWGDGTQVAGGIRLLGAAAGATGVVGADHIYAAPGDYQITVIINDAGGSRTEALSEAIITAGKIAVVAANKAAVEGQAFAGQVARFGDANPAEVAGNFIAVINWGDGIITPGVVAAAAAGFTVSGTHTYDEGVFPYLVTVTDENGNSASSTATFTVADAALTPIAAGALSSIAGQTLVNVPVGSFSDANPLATTSDFSVSIDWGDGPLLDAGTVIKGPGFFDVVGSHKYVKEGSYSISVVINDIGGSTTTVANSAIKRRTPLSLAYPATLWATESLPVSQVVATFTDSDPTSSLADIADILVNWETEPPTTAAAATSRSPSLPARPDGVTYVVSGTHTYDDDDEDMEIDGYQVLVVVRDVGGSVTEAASSANVADPTLADPPFPVQAMEGVAFDGKVASFTDSNPYLRPADFSATLTWGDGQTSAGTIVTNPSGGFLVLGDHTYAQAGGYATGVTIRDHEGHSVSDGSIATVAAAPLSAMPLAVSAKPRVSFQAPVAAFADPNALATPASFSATISWGDGSLTSGTMIALGTSPAGSTFAVEGVHKYKKQGHFKVTVLIADTGGGKTIASGLATISPKVAKAITPKPPKSTQRPAERTSRSEVAALAAPAASVAPVLAPLQAHPAAVELAAPTDVIDLALSRIDTTSVTRRHKRVQDMKSSLT